jgi:hypothetical protein
VISPSIGARIRTVAPHHREDQSIMDYAWSILKERAVFISFAGDAFHFDVSWLGIILIVAAMMLWRRLRR